MPDVPVEQPIDMLVDRFIKLRDGLKVADEAHKEKTKAAREYLDQLNAQLLMRLNALGGESVKTRVGTVYRSSRKSASIADGKAFREFVTEGGHFDLLDWKANATAVADFIDAHEAPPPGVSFSVAFQVGVRRGVATAASEPASNS